MTRLAASDPAENAWTVLQRSSHPAFRGIICDSTDRGVVLRGQVPTYYLKQMAQTLLMHRFGDQLQVQNELTVSWRMEDRCRREGD